MPTPIITDGSIGRVPQSPRIVLPTNAQRFAERADRFEALANGHPMADYLRAMAQIARAQQVALQARAATPIAEPLLASSRQYGMPPVSAQSHERGAEWRADLRDIVATVRRSASGQLRDTLAQLAALGDDALETLAERLIVGTTLDADAAFVPFVGAALQVYFSRLAATLQAGDVEKCDVATVCPVCATRPVASVLRIGPQNALRYLHCALCETEWNMVRVKCSSCEADKGLAYLSIEQEGRSAADAVTKAETCGECRSYLKIFNQDKDAFVDPVADDLATLALDVLVDEQGFARSGPNLLFHPGTG
ncbi:MAG: formate dehydrogenase accessory protein FdhE [Burkholderiaceae bacterium]|nr:formate dehydrogenase accessory protein FdhE [Burkholderiaceae bacterium]